MQRPHRRPRLPLPLILHQHCKRRQQGRISGDARLGNVNVGDAAIVAQVAEDVAVVEAAEVDAGQEYLVHEGRWWVKVEPGWVEGWGSYSFPARLHPQSSSLKTQHLLTKCRKINRIFKGHKGDRQIALVKSRPHRHNVAVGGEQGHDAVFDDGEGSGDGEVGDKDVSVVGLHRVITW